MKRLVCAALAACALGGAAAANADERRGGFLMDLDLAYGGDDLVTLSFEDGGTQDIKAGQGIGFALGGWYRPSQEMPLELQGALGFKYVTTAADNADISVSRTTLQLNAIYRFTNDWYLGAGLVRHMGPKLDGDGWFEDIEFDDATGFNVQVGWKWIGLQVTRMDYSADGYQDADAGSVGLRFTWRPGA